MIRRRCWPAVALLAATPFLAAPARADWLVLGDGSRVETRGAWEERGATVVFHLPNGTLGSVRARDVDREATAAANAPPPAQPTAAPSSSPKPVLVLTDADVGHVDAAQFAAEQAAAAAAKAPAAQPTTPPSRGAAKPPERLEVTTWRRDAASATTVTLVGEVRNISSAVTAGVRVTALLYDEKGELIATSDAILGADVLQPGQSTNFRASFPGVANYSTAKFETKHFALKVAEPPAQ
ncbi:MAG TPA: FxLYD domain-containing protein [Thermoanaerobaculia bacterium]|nr:FxLYD domain-containing protein [Thermoanaerobaculia bacterium]